MAYIFNQYILSKGYILTFFMLILRGSKIDPLERGHFFLIFASRFYRFCGFFGYFKNRHFFKNPNFWIFSKNEKIDFFDFWEIDKIVFCKGYTMLYNSYIAVIYIPYTLYRVYIGALPSTSPVGLKGVWGYRGVWGGPGPPGAPPRKIGGFSGPPPSGGF